MIGNCGDREAGNPTVAPSPLFAAEETKTMPYLEISFEIAQVILTLDHLSISVEPRKLRCIVTML